MIIIPTNPEAYRNHTAFQNNHNMLLLPYRAALAVCDAPLFANLVECACLRLKRTSVKLFRNCVTQPYFKIG